jgi:hypothetical protein
MHRQTWGGAAQSRVRLRLGDLTTIDAFGLVQTFGLTNTRCRAKKGKTSVEILPWVPQ